MEWIQTLNRIAERRERNLDELLYSRKANQGKDMGLIHPETGAGLMARANGEVVAFADQGIGFRMDPASQTLSLYAPKMKFFCFEHKFYDYEEAENPVLQEEYQTIIELLGGKIDGEI